MARKQKGNQKSKKATKAGKKVSSSSERQSSPTHQHRLGTLRSATSKPSGTPSLQNGFSMFQQARNTERHSSGWSNTPLRGNAISFVSAGHLVRDEPPSSNQAQEPSDKPDQAQVEDQVAEQNVPAPADTAAPLPSATGAAAAEEAAAEQVETRHDPGLDSDSSSGDEKIVFQGRAKQCSQPISRTATPALQSVRSPPRQPLSSSWSQKARRNRSPGRGKSGLNQVLFISDEEEALMQDYIANMAVEDDEDDEDDGNDNDQPSRRTKTFRFYSGTGKENAKVQTKSAFASAAAPQPVDEQVDQGADWHSSDLDDFDELPTTDEEMNEIGQVLRHRVRPSGAQYLVTPVAKGADDAKWVLHSKLISSTTAAKIRTYHEIIKMRTEDGHETIHSSDDEDDDLDDIMDDIESEDAENAAIIARTARMTDEQIARALAKQEELGIGVDQLVLFDGQEGEDDDGSGDAFRRNAAFVPFSVGAPSSKRSRAKNRGQMDVFPAAEAFADALDEDPYGGFDVMDFERPSVRPRRKGKKNDFAFDFNLSDQDLALHIKSQWQKDRDKKASRKREKMEQLEAQLIEAEARNSPAAIRAEIRRFLIEECDTLELAPMSSHLRAGVHRLAKTLNLNSRSIGKDGKGIGRYPVLTKTANTPPYSIDTVWQVDAVLQSRKFFPWTNTPKTGKSSGGRRGGRGGVADASFRTGDIVGASAPELGADNKGRAMLEKMGWTSGTGIGAHGNKGRLLAIEQVVRRGRTGLG